MNSVISLTLLEVRVWSSASVLPSSYSLNSPQLPVGSSVQFCLKSNVGDVAAAVRQAAALHFLQVVEAVDAVKFVEVGRAGHRVLPPQAIARLVVTIIQPHHIDGRAGNVLPEIRDHAAEAVQAGVMIRARGHGQVVLHDRLGILHLHRTTRPR